MSQKAGRFELDYLHASAGIGEAIPTAVVKLKHDGQVLQDASPGNGPVDAAVKVIKRLTGTDGRLTHFVLRASTPGEDAAARAILTVEFASQKFTAEVTHTDIVTASVLAYLECVNNFLQAER